MWLPQAKDVRMYQRHTGQIGTGTSARFIAVSYSFVRRQCACGEYVLCR